MSDIVFCPFNAEFDSDYGCFEEIQYMPLTGIEKVFCLIFCVIRNKHLWHIKYQNPEIRQKWIQELEDAWNNGVFSVEGNYQWQDVKNYVLKELDQLCNISPNLFSGVDNVFASDEIIGEELRQEFVDLCKSLEVPESEKDYHPNSNNQVVNLIHPSLYPIVYGRTRIIPEEHKAQSIHDWKLTLEHVKEGKEAQFISLKTRADGSLYSPVMSEKNKEKVVSTFQWLPSIFQVSEDGKTVSIKSYINNLHPEKHSDIYTVLELIFAKSIPLLEKTLNAIQNPIPPRTTWGFDERESYTYFNHVEKFLGDKYNPNGTQQNEDPEAFMDYLCDNMVFPKIPENVSDKILENINKQYSINGKSLKIITKISSIHLTPENPDYLGGNWHVEATESEQIVATIIYYYDVENITESRLNFRRVCQTPEYDQCEYEAIQLVYGLEYEGALVQDVGYTCALQGRILCFPNMYQHCVAPFSLSDKTFPGHRKILVFFVVDPNGAAHTIASDRVPPQQESWIKPLGEKVVDNVAKHLMTHKEACDYRLELMSQRSDIIKEISKSVYGVKFDLCEH